MGCFMESRKGEEKTRGNDVAGQALLVQVIYSLLGSYLVCKISDKLFY